MYRHAMGDNGSIIDELKERISRVKRVPKIIPDKDLVIGGLREDGTTVKQIHGKLNKAKVLAGLMAGKKHHEIAVEAGSAAKTRKGQSLAIYRILKTDEFKKMAGDVIQRSYRGITDAKIKQANYTALVTGLEKLSRVAGLADKEMGVDGGAPHVVVNVDKVLNYYANGKASSHTDRDNSDPTEGVH